MTGAGKNIETRVYMKQITKLKNINKINEGNEICSARTLMVSIVEKNDTNRQLHICLVWATMVCHTHSHITRASVNYTVHYTMTVYIE